MKIRATLPSIKKASTKRTERRGGVHLSGVKSAAFAAALAFSLAFLTLPAISTLGADPQAKALTNLDLLKMLEAKLPESVIISQIRNSKVQFDTSTDALIKLHKKGVGEKVLNAILEPSDRSAGTQVADPNPAQQPKASALPPASSIAVSGEKADPLSYGTATGLVKKGSTTQRELLELFGGPSVMTTDKDGTEVWMYDKTTSTVSSNSKQTTLGSRTSEAEVMAGFFGIPLVGAIGGARARGKEDTKTETEGAGTVSRSIKTITFIIKFNQDKTVKDYSVRQAVF